MHHFINSFMSNDSPFGRLMTKIGIIICANLMFILFSLLSLLHAVSLLIIQLIFQIIFSLG